MIDDSNNGNNLNDENDSNDENTNNFGNEPNENTKEYYVYLLITNWDETFENCKTYIGATVNLDRRLKQHNGILSGGAKYTRKYKGSWKRICSIHNFPTWNSALQFEWKLKNISKKIKNMNNLEKKIYALGIILSDKKSTSKSIEFRLWTKPPMVKIEIDEAVYLFKKYEKLMSVVEFK
jgi:predicted GIY-YIG superfamily endonuclease